MASERDLVGELGEAVRPVASPTASTTPADSTGRSAACGIDSMRSLVAAIPQTRRVRRYADAHWRELIERYEPAVLWNDIGYPVAGRTRRSSSRDYYNAHARGRREQPLRLHGRRRWHRAHGLHDSRVLAQMDDITADKWEACRGIGHSFGLNRNAADDDLLTVDALVHLLADIVSEDGTCC